MPDRSTAQIVRLLLVTMLLVPLLARAQSEQLYRVELLVFSQPPAGGSAEQWDGLPELSYPQRSRFLRYPGEQSPQGAAAPMSAAPGESTTATGNGQPTASQTDLFAALPSTQRELAGKAAAMQRSGRYRILFHEAWIQPMSGQADALPIILDQSGNGGAWPALQGSIKIYLSRYFYLETNLWLNTQGEYLQGSWRMPAPPVSPAREEVLQAPLNRYNTTAPSTASLQPTAIGAQSPVAGQQAEQEVTGPDYPYRHAVLLQQTRRMRSGQLAYIDHPLLGVLVQITPLAGAEDASVE